jgi:hypothetical protein
LDVFCVTKCIDYFDTHCSNLETDDTAGECQRPIVQNSVCMVTTVNTVKGMGDSLDYLGCTAGYYLLNFECVLCNQASQWIDYQGLNCLTTCDVLDDIFAVNGLRLCRTKMPACATDYKPQATGTTGSMSLTCVNCTQLKDMNGFCVVSCADYFHANPGCNGVAGSLVVANSCNRPIEDTNVCIIPQETTIVNLDTINGNSGNFGPCETPNFYIRDFVCIPCTGLSDYIDYQGVYCRSACTADNFLFMDATHKICVESAPTCVGKMIAALATDGFYKLTCDPCSNVDQFTSGDFCLDSCQDYFYTVVCQNNRALGRCNYEYVSSDAVSCQATCATYIYSANNDKVCAQTCAVGKFNHLDEVSLVLTCSACGLPKKQLDVFCIDSCKQYFLAHCNPLIPATTDSTGECQRPIEQDGICING